MEAKKALQVLRIKYRMLFPVMLCITYDDKVFKTVAEALRYIEKIRMDNNGTE